MVQWHGLSSLMVDGATNTVHILFLCNNAKKVLIFMRLKTVKFRKSMLCSAPFVQATFELCCRRECGHFVCIPLLFQRLNSGFRSVSHTSQMGRYSLDGSDQSCPCRRVVTVKARHSTLFQLQQLSPVCHLRQRYYSLLTPLPREFTRSQAQSLDLFNRN